MKKPSQHPLAPRTPLRLGQTGSRSLNKALSGQVTEPAAAAAPVNGVAAALTTALTGNNNDLVFTAKTKGAAGNSITITYVDPGEETATETVEVTGTDIVVTLRSVSATLSTAAQVKAAIEADAGANALVAVANAAANDGSGSVIAMAEDALEGGVDCTVAEAGSFVFNGGYLYYTPTATTKSSATWVRSQFATF